MTNVKSGFFCNMDYSFLSLVDSLQDIAWALAQKPLGAKSLLECPAGVEQPIIAARMLRRLLRATARVKRRLPKKAGHR